MGGKLRLSEWVLIVAIVAMAVATWVANSQRPDTSRVEKMRTAPALVDLDVPL